VWGLVVAIAFPLGHALTTVAILRKISPIAVLAFISVLLTGGIGIFEVETRWFAYKEAVFPFGIGIAAVVSVKTRWPAIPSMLNQLLNGDKVDELLAANGKTEENDTALVRASWMLGAIFLVTAIGTFIFARWMVVSPAGTEAFNTELGSYTGLAFPVLGIPSTAAMVWVLHRVIIGIESRTGVKIDDLME
jgi:hypothetical protein